MSTSQLNIVVIYRPGSGVRITGPNTNRIVAVNYTPNGCWVGPPI